MSQIEHNFRIFLAKHPEIERCHGKRLLNRRSLARYLINEGVGESKQIDAIIAMLRRYEFTKQKIVKTDFPEMSIRVKDDIIILDTEKNKQHMQQLEKIIAKTDYAKGDTLKIVVGTSTIKIFTDKAREKELVDSFAVRKMRKSLSELSMIFPGNADSIKGTIATITSEFLLYDITITELLTATPELLIYIDEQETIRAYEILKRLQKKLS